MPGSIPGSPTICSYALMAHMGFFDLSDRYASLGAKKDPLVEIGPGPKGHQEWLFPGGRIR